MFTLPSATQLAVPDDLGKIISNLWDAAVVIAGVGFLILLLVGGIQYMNSGGNPEEAKKAQGLIINAIIGLILVVLAFPIGNKVLEWFKVKTP